jgi:hypothetical protein
MHDLFREMCGHFVTHELLCELSTLLSVASCSIFFPEENPSLVSRVSSAVRRLH